jgi:hypothetical protein
MVLGGGYLLTGLLLGRARVDRLIDRLLDALLGTGRE